MENNLFDSVFHKLNEMEKNQAIDESILSDFSYMEKQLAKYEGDCASSKDRKIEDAFLLFHVMRNSRMILEKVSARFTEAKAKHENPVVVDLSKMVIPRLNDLYTFTVPIFQNEKHVLTQGERNAILTRLKIVRDVASVAGMLPSVEDEKEGILKSDLSKKFQGMATSLQACVNEE
jgi:hypothetical protein